jgi:7-carboxy-7-deazaguanine synthase
MASERTDPRTLRIREIYRSIQGESTRAGWPCAFVRTAGCDIRCVWCDEPHALTAERSESLSIDEIVARVRALDVRMVELTGGEPLLQAATPALVCALLDAGLEVLIETGGHRDVSLLDPRCKVILDVKAPGSGMESHNDPANLARLKPGDEVKYVLANRTDYEWARKHLLEHRLAERVPVQFSPVHGVLDPRDLAAWILEDGLHVRLNLQLHKYVWGAEAKGV